MVTVTKRKDGQGLYGPRWRVLVNGRATVISIEKSVPPKYRHPQKWDVIDGDDPHNVLFDADSLDAALRVIQTLNNI